MKFKTADVENYESGEITIKYTMRNRTSLTPRDGYDSLLQLTLTIYIGEGNPLNVMATIPAHLLEIFTIEELIQKETKSMVRNMAMFIHKEMDIAKIYSKHIKAHKAMNQGD